MKNLFGCFGVILILPLIVIGAILFNAWYLQVVYNIGVSPVCSQFGLFLPQLGYWVFVLMWVVFGSLHTLFKYSDMKTTNKDKESEKKSYSIWNKEELAEGAAKVFEPIISNIMTKLCQLLILYCAYNICF